MNAFEALAEPHRRRMLDLLREREMAVGDVVRRMRMSQPAVSKHLRVLREAGLVSVRVDGQKRCYRVRHRPLHEVERWLAPYREMWNERLDALERRLSEMDEPTVKRRRNKS